MELGADSNLFDLFLGRVHATPNAPAYRQFVNDVWVDVTWAEVAREVARFRAALARENLKPGERVALCLRNRLEWVCFDQAAASLGLVTVPLYFDDRPDNMAFCLNDAGCKLLLLENAAPWPALRTQVQSLARVVCLERADADSDPRLTRLTDWLPMQAGELARAPSRPDELATLVYTSGTTGRPKGVMLSHRNILSNVAASLKAIPVYPGDRLLSFLPLSHMFERTCGYYLGMQAGGQTVYARSISLLAEDLRTQRPTVLIAVPRIFERIHARMQEGMPPGSFKRRLFERAVDIGWKRFRHQASFLERLLWPLFKLLVANKLKRRVGGRLRLIVVGGAAFAPEHARVFVGLGLPIIQGYGLTESGPVIACNRASDNDPLSVGRALEGVALRLGESDELLVRGPGVMLGYWNNADATRATIDADGWLHTGDRARIENGRVYITGRLKDIIVLSNGEKLPPADAEAAILRDNIFEQVMVVGEGRPKLGLLCVSRARDEAELCARANAQLHDFPGYARICHIARLETPWSVEDGQLTPTLKLKRNEILRRHAADIERMYAISEICCPNRTTGNLGEA
ncbi:MAG: long-chain fatty acid--CoA ligase [Gammaproteobacteria bacterium]|nr:long-chain fatty acid--CoA ligase [Gammaproteobacteria bacterium]